MNKRKILKTILLICFYLIGVYLSFALMALAVFIEAEALPKGEPTTAAEACAFIALVLAVVLIIIPVWLAFKFGLARRRRKSS